MNQQIRSAVTSWMNQQGIRNPEEISLQDYQLVRGLLSGERSAFGVFLSMMMFERQQAVAQLTNADLSSSTGAVAAAKLQGIILAVDNMRDLILNIADPIVEGSDLDEREVAGVRFDGRTGTEQPVVG